MTINFLFQNNDKSVLRACINNCLMLKCFIHEYQFKTCYASRFLQQSTPRIPPSSARGSIDHYDMSKLAFLFSDRFLSLMTLLRSNPVLLPLKYLLGLEQG